MASLPWRMKATPRSQCQTGLDGDAVQGYVQVFPGKREAHDAAGLQLPWTARSLLNHLPTVGGVG